LPSTETSTADARAPGETGPYRRARMTIAASANRSPTTECVTLSKVLRALYYPFGCFGAVTSLSSRERAAIDRAPHCEHRSRSRGGSRRCRRLRRTIRIPNGRRRRSERQRGHGRGREREWHRRNGGCRCLAVRRRWRVAVRGCWRGTHRRHRWNDAGRRKRTRGNLERRHFGDEWLGSWRRLFAAARIRLVQRLLPVVRFQPG